MNIGYRIELRLLVEFLESKQEYTYSNFYIKKWKMTDSNHCQQYCTEIKALEIYNRLSSVTTNFVQE